MITVKILIISNLKFYNGSTKIFVSEFIFFEFFLKFSILKADIAEKCILMLMKNIFRQTSSGAI